MANLSVNIRLIANGAETVNVNYSKSQEIYHALGGGIFGDSEDWMHSIYADSGTHVAYGGLSLQWKERRQNAQIYHNGVSGHQHSIKAHLGVRAFTSGVMRVVVTASFRKTETQVRSLAKDFNYAVDDAQKNYQYMGDMSSYTSSWDWASWNLQFVSGSEFSAKLTNSSSDPNITSTGTHLWIRYTDDILPVINISAPANDTVFDQSMVRPIISGTFSDEGSAVDPSLFQLKIGALEVKDGDAGLTLNSNDFSFTPQSDLNRSRHQLFIQVGDQHGNMASATSSFSILEDDVPPDIINFQPDVSQKITVLQPTISADFTDTGVGIKIGSFELRVDGVIIPTGNPGLTVTPLGFSYTPTSPLAISKHTILISLRDQSDNIALRQYTLDVQPVNTSIGSLDLEALDRIGPATANKYNVLGINTIEELSLQDSYQLANDSGVAAEDTLDHVNRANLLFRDFIIRGNFPAAFLDRNVEEVTIMDDAILDSETNSQLNSEEKTILKRSLSLLFICIDDSVIPTLRFGDFITT